MSEKQKNYNIIPGIGLNSVRFGMLGDHVEKLIGPPEQKCYQKNGDILFWYDNDWFSFSGDDDFKLISIEVGIAQGVKIFEKDLTNKSISEILDIFPYYSIEIDKIGHGQDFIGTNIIIDELSLIIYCDEDDYAESVILSVKFDNNDEIIWPNTIRENG